MNWKLGSMTVAVFIVMLLSLAVIFFIPHNFVGDGLVKEDTSVPKNNLQQAFLLTPNQPNYFPLRNSGATEPNLLAKAAILADTNSGKILYQKNSTQQLPMASLTKLMTAVVIMEHLDLGSIIKISPEDLNSDGYGADLVAGELIKASELIKMMLIKSSNDAALAFVRHAKLQSMDLVGEMNNKAAELGMINTRFSDPAGLNDSAFSTATDLVKLVQYVNKYPLIWKILLLPNAEITSVDGKIVHHLVNTDKLLNELPGIIGGKTGFTEKAMGTMILIVSTDGGRNSIIGVILGSKDRFSDIRQLVEWGRNSYRWR